MSLISWTSALSVDNSTIDEQHQKLVAILNRMFDAMKVGKGREVLGSILKELIDYTVYHFDTEEKLMKAHNYPGYADHKKQHEDLKAKAVDLWKQHSEGKVVVTTSVLSFLKDWLTNHIGMTDKALGAFLKNV